MSATKHTPGPWTAFKIAGDWNIGPANSSPADKRSHNRLWLACVPTVKFDGAAIPVTEAGGSAAEQDANARLIAAAPELLEALGAVVSQAKAQFNAGDRHATFNQAFIKTLEAALAKAKPQ